MINNVTTTLVGFALVTRSLGFSTADKPCHGTPTTTLCAVAIV